MWKSVEFVKTAVIGGFFVVLPIALALLVLNYLLRSLANTLEPLLAELPADEVAGIGLDLLAAALLLLLVCFVAGILIRTRVGQGLNDWLEETIFNRIPGFTLLRNLTRRFSPEDAGGVVLARIHPGDARVLAFVAEEIDEERVAIFVPSAPTPTVGAVYIVDRDRLEWVGARAPATLNCLMQWGIGAREILARRA